MVDFSKLWNEVSIHLNNASNLLFQEKLNEFQTEMIMLKEYLEHNELELALDELENLGRNNKLSKEFWKELFKAAELMNLSRHKKRYSTKFE